MIVHTAQGIFFQVGEELVPFAQTDTQRIFGLLDDNEGLIQTLKTEILQKFDESVAEYRRQFVEFDTIALDTIMARIGTLVNYRAICYVAYKQYQEQKEAARNGS